MKPATGIYGNILPYCGVRAIRVANPTLLIETACAWPAGPAAGRWLPAYSAVMMVGMGRAAGRTAGMHNEVRVISCQAS